MNNCSTDKTMTDRHSEMQDTGYRVVPEWRTDLKKFELVIVPWDYETNTRDAGRKKRTGFLFAESECKTSRSKPSAFFQKWAEVEIILINHLKKKHENKKSQTH